MRCVLVLCTVMWLISCDGGNEQRPVSDSAITTSSPDTISFAAVKGMVNTILLPALVHSDSLQGFPPILIDEKSAYDLLPGEFDFESYNKVYCLAYCRIGVKPILWFRLESAADFEESEDNVDILMVLYDCNNRPIDVYNVAHSDLGFGYSYVRSDSIFTLEFDEMENINITTTELFISETGFIPRPSVTTTFDPGKEGYTESRAFAEKYLLKHGYAQVTNE